MVSIYMVISVVANWMINMVMNIYIVLKIVNIYVVHVVGIPSDRHWLQYQYHVSVFQIESIIPLFPQHI